MDITDKKIKEIDKYLIDTLSPDRYRHSLSTGKTAEKLCENFGLNPDKGFFTGLIHDIAREYDKKALINICLISGEKMHDWEIKDPVLLHGKAGAALLKDKFSINDEEILEAVRVHTTGVAGMSSMAKVLFVSDYIEPERKHITEEYIESIENESLDSMVKTVLSSVLDYIKTNDMVIADPSIELLKELQV
jgi:nicotinate-nucleotide adenylyltransferase